MNDLIAVEHSQTKQICELELDLDAVKTKVTDFELEMEQQEEARSHIMFPKAMVQIMTHPNLATLTIASMRVANALKRC